MEQKQLVVIGAGAAGFFCAVNAARLNPNLKVTILEKSNKLLSKVRISGGGRCNVTHACLSTAALLKNYPRGANFLKKPFHQFNTGDTINWFKERSVALKTEADGRMFPESNTSATIIDCLMQEANKYQVDIRMNAAVQHIAVVSKDTDTAIVATKKFRVHYGADKFIMADFVCIAAGGFPQAAQFDWIKSTGHGIESPVPSLFTFNLPKHPITQLMGVSVPDVMLKITGTKLQQRGPVLITHWGLSGPAVLKLSAWAARDLADKGYRAEVVINWLPEMHEQSLLAKFKIWRFEFAAQKMTNRNPVALPSRLWLYLLQQAGISDHTRWADLPAKEQNLLARLICQGSFDIQGKTTFKEEFVTAGGISLQQIDPSSMESKIVPGLYFAGEVMDVDGVTGGFNFQQAWTSGWIAATAIAAT